MSNSARDKIIYEEEKTGGFYGSTFGIYNGPNGPEVLYHTGYNILDQLSYNIEDCTDYREYEDYLEAREELKRLTKERAARMRSYEENSDA